MPYPNLTATIGKTPLVELGRLAKDLPGRVLAKLEMRNPSGSVKDRVAGALVDDAESRGTLKPGMRIVEATGGNTGIGLAFVAAIRGYRLILTMPETMSVERVALLRQLGAEVVLTPGILMADALAQAARIVQEHPGAVILDQFRNPANPEIHRRTTAVEIWEDTQGTVDYFVSAVGTGGTITGVGEVLKKRKPGVRIVAVEPANAAVLSGRPAGNHQIQGIGIGFVADVLNRSILDELVAVTDEDAFSCARRLAREEGIVAGASSGAALHAALALAARKEAAGKSIVVILADTGERYITTSLFHPEKPKAQPVAQDPRHMDELAAAKGQAMSSVPLWFERKFDFTFPIENYPNLRMRLWGTPGRLEELVRDVPHHVMIERTAGKWSAQEHAGHLADLEPLWLVRVEDFLAEVGTLANADLTNRKTEEANHNARTLGEILAEFRDAKRRLLDRVEQLSPRAFRGTKLHPRLKQPMRLVDHLYFVAEHDDHHLAKIWEMRKNPNK